MALLMPYDPLAFRSMYQREDSEDSDGEGGLGNVSRVLIRPPGHSGKAKKGHLCFDASFETGNLGRVDLIGDFEYDLFIRPDTCSPRFRCWFNFTVDNFKQDQRVIFNIVNFSKSKLLFRDILTPIVKSSSKPQWQRIPRDHVWYHRSSAHRGHYVLSFAFAFHGEEEVYQFALSTPYSYSRLQSYLRLVEQRTSAIRDEFSQEIIGKSIQNRSIDLVTIGQLPQSDLISREKKRVVVILARVHAGEAPSSYICQGIMDFMASSHQSAIFLREHIIIKIVPMLNPDGVFLGNYKSTLMGFDLNRSWHIATQWAHPTLWCVIQMLKALDDSNVFQLDFVFDIHAHTSLMGCFIYGNTYEDIYRYERHIVFPKLLGHNADDYNPKNTMYNTDTHKVGTARRHLCAMLSDYVNCYTLEVSMGGYSLQNSSSPDMFIPYTKESYLRLGRNFVRTFIDYYRMVGVIAIDLPQEIRSRKDHHRSRSQYHRRQKSRSPLDYYLNKRSTSYQRCSAPVHYTDIIAGNELEEDPTAASIYPNSFFKTSHCDHQVITSHFLQKKSKLPPTKWKVTKQHPKGASYFIPSDKTLKHQTISPIMNYAPLPSLSIIDFNQLTRGGLDKAKIKQELHKKSMSKKR